MTLLALENVTLAATGFDFALQQPLFPGKLLLWGLFMLSLLSSAVIVSKLISLHRMKRADEDFSRRFRAGRHPLQMFERNYDDGMSLRGLVYQYAAKETAFQMLGSPDRDETFSVRLRSSDQLTESQMKLVRDALDRGEMAAAAKLKDGMPILATATLAAPFCGLLGMAWILMKTFSQHGMNGTLADVSPGVSGALAMLVVGLLVATLSLVGHILLGSMCRERLRQVGDFRAELARSIEYAFVLGNEMPDFEEEALSSDLHHDQPLTSRDRVQEEKPETSSNLSGDEIDKAITTYESGVAEKRKTEVESAAAVEDSPFLLIEDDSDEDPAAVADRPVATFAEIDAREEPPPLEEDGFLFSTPFADEGDAGETLASEEPLNPIARQTAMAGSV